MMNKLKFETEHRTGKQVTGTFLFQELEQKTEAELLELEQAELAKVANVEALERQLISAKEANLYAEVNARRLREFREARFPKLVTAADLPPLPSAEEWYEMARKQNPDLSTNDARIMIGKMLATPPLAGSNVDRANHGGLRTFERGKHSASGDSERMVETTQPVGQTNYDIEKAHWHEMIGHPGSPPEQLLNPPEGGN